MDYTPISARRVLVAFTLTAFVALAPAVFVILHSRPVTFLGEPRGSYGGMVLGAETVAIALILLSVVVFVGRRVVRRPSRA